MTARFHPLLAAEDINLGQTLLLIAISPNGPPGNRRCRAANAQVNTGQDRVFCGQIKIALNLDDPVNIPVRILQI